MFSLELHLAHDGWWIVDAYTAFEEGPFSELGDAKRKLAEHEKDWSANYEPPDPPGWEGGFAANH
jgi:hypothetical protein